MDFNFFFGIAKRCTEIIGQSVEMRFFCLKNHLTSSKRDDGQKQLFVETFFCSKVEKCKKAIVLQ